MTRATIENIKGTFVNRLVAVQTLRPSFALPTTYSHFDANSPVSDMLGRGLHFIKARIGDVGFWDVASEPDILDM